MPFTTQPRYHLPLQETPVPHHIQTTYDHYHQRYALMYSHEIVFDYGNQ